MNATITSDGSLREHAYVVRASCAQRSLWFLDQLTPGSSLYNLHTGMRFRSVLDVTVLERSITEIVRRHESLRTGFKALNGEPAQVVASFLNPRLPVTDLRYLAEPERENTALRIAAEEARTPFDLSIPPLMRTRLLRLEDEDHIFLLTIHHIVCDFWSLEIFQKELSALYEAFGAGQPSPLPELPIQYADFAEWEWQSLQGPVGEAHLAYWKRQLADLPVLRLPTDTPRPRVSSFTGAAHEFWLSESLHRALAQLSRAEKATLFMTMLAAFQTLLHRYTAQDDIAVGAPVANRNRTEVESLIGFFVNSLVLRTDFSGNPSFRELLARVRDIVLDAFAHQDLPFEKLVHELNPERPAGSNPLFQVHFQVFSDLGPIEIGTTKSQDKLAGEFIASEVETAKFDLALDLWEHQDGISAHLEYSTELFSAETIARMEQHFCTLLEGIVADPDQHLSDLPLLSADERQRVVVDWNGGGLAYQRSACLNELFEAQAARTPEAIALVFRNEQVTYDALNRRANQLARYLQLRSVGPDVLVAICVERSIEMIVGLLGILKAGGAYLPLNPSDPQARLQSLMEDARPRMLLTQERFVQRIPSYSVECLRLDADWPKVERFDDRNRATEANSLRLAYVIYTSGSTGVPKGVMVESQAVSNHLLWMQSSFPLSSEDRVLQKYPFNFDASVCEIFGTLAFGARLIIAEPSEHWDISQFVHLLDEHRVTVLDVLPSMLDTLLEEDGFVACGALRRVICGGELLKPELRDRFFKLMSAELHNIYGPTEATIGTTSFTCLPQHTAQSVPIGRPSANTQVYILDRWLNPVPIGVPGELFIGGAGVARGYLNQPRLTSEKFIPNPFSSEPNACLYKTGDLARYLPDGNLEYCGRIDQQVKLRGHRVEAGEVESTLARHASVEECVVVPVENESGRTMLAAYIVPAPDRPELWPSLGEYNVYDELLYYAMTHDEGRNRSYRAAISQSVKGKVVLDIGAGADAVLSRFCLEGGAQRVYAIELREDAWRSATKLVENLGLTNRIVLINGDSTHVQLPEKVDVCVSEILGTIGSSEGAASILNDARRFLKNGGIMIPRRCITRFAAVSLPEELAESLRLSELPSFYVQQVFQKFGYPFDLRMCISNLPLGSMISQAQVFEDLDFTGFVPPEHEADVRLTIERKSRLDGFLLWLYLYPGLDEPVDSLHNRLSWLPVFFPAFYPGVEVSRGDVIEARCSRWLGSDGPMPDYAISGSVIRAQGEQLSFTFSSPYHTTAFRQTAFYASLFAGMNGNPKDVRPGDWQLSNNSNDKETGKAYEPERPPEELAVGLVPTLRRFLQENLPEYMIPSSFVVLRKLPRLPSGKLDRRALPAPGRKRPELQEAFFAPRNETEDVLAGIWRKVLSLERIGVHDNFFELGGDSILSLQIIARANQAGLRLRPAQLFQYQTIAELASVVSSAAAIEAEQGGLTGEVPLTPVQRWFFERNFPEPHHYNQSVLITVPSPFDASRLGVVLNRLVEHHDALRLRFTLTESGWRQAFAPAVDAVTIPLLNLADLPKAEQNAAFEKASAELQSSLDLSAGPLVRALLIDVGDSNAAYLLLVIHHLVIDSMSWRILLDDFWTAYNQVTEGTEIQLPAKTTSFQLWAQRLMEYAQSPELEQEAAYWLTLSETTEPRLPRDNPEGERIAATVERIVVSLSPLETQVLLRDLPKVFHTEINDVLLTALVQAFAQWTGQDSIFIDVEGHGREPITRDVDPSRTIGWFTSIFPVRLELERNANPEEALHLIKEQLRRVPHRGIGYGLLRYLSGKEDLRDALKSIPEREVVFKYSGPFGQTESETSCRTRAIEPPRPNLSPESNRPNILEIDGSVAGGRLEMVWTYSADVHRRSSIEKLTVQFMEALQILVRYCSRPNVSSYAPADFQDIYELSPLQEGMLFHTLYEPASSVYIEQESYPLFQAIDVPILVRSWQQMLERHTVLRSSFHWEGIQKPVQVVHRQAQLPADVQDWQGTPPGEQEERLDAYLRSVRERGFDLTKAPLIHLAIIKRGNEFFQVVLTFHHILLDGWSGEILTDEVWALYEALCEGTDPQLPPVRPYGDFISWLQQQDLEKAEAFWRRALKGFASPTRFEVDQRGGEASGANLVEGERSLRLSKRITARLLRFVRENRLTLNTVTQGIWAVILSRYSGDTDVLFGTVVSGRPATLSGVESMVGLFINTLPLRAAVAADAFPVPWLRDLQDRQVEAREYDYTPLARIQGWSEVPPGVPLFESVVIFANYPSSSGSQAEEDDEPIEGFRHFSRTNYPLNLMVVPGSELELTILYSRQRFHDAVIARMLGHFQMLLEGLMANPDRPLSDLPLLTQSERQQLLVDWNATEAEYPRSMCIHELFEAQVARTPEALALMCEGRELTYGEMNRRANQLGRYLCRHGLGTEMRVGICMDRSLEMVVGLLATLKAGGAYVPLDPAWPKERLGFMINDGSLDILLTQERLRALLPQNGVRFVCLDRWEAFGDESGENLAIRVTADNLAYLIYTSGSTGRPKGVLGLHRGAANRFAWMSRAYPFRPGDVCCARTSLSFVDSVQEIFGPLLSGVPNVVIPDDQMKDIHQLVETLERFHVTRLVLVPSLLSAMLDSFDDLGRSLPELRYWITSGEAISAELCRRFQQNVPHGRLINLYGSSEVAGDATCFDISGAAPLVTVPIGRPISNVQTYIVDRNVKPVPVGVPGELLIGGDALARGYNNMPNLSAEKFILNPFAGEHGGHLFRTGDIVKYLSDGNIEFIGRTDHQVKLRGHRIELGEVEAALLRHEAVREAVVVTSEDDSGDRRLMAYVVRNPDYSGPILRDTTAGGSPEQILGWREVWDETYRQEPTQKDPEFNINGWKSTYTGLPIPAEEMREWVEQAVERVLDLQPQNVLEIGAGSGMLLFRVAPHCSRYWATDFSSVALNYLQRQLTARNLPQVCLQQRSAEDFGGMQPESFDAVVLNSIVQYFPNVDYLVKVLEGAVNVVRPGGSIFVGDVRSLPLMEVLHTSVELRRAPASLPAGKLQQRVRKRLDEEEELVVDPCFFFALQRHIPQISHIRIEPKRGRYHNELTQFRYEVILRVKSTESETAANAWLDWKKEDLSLPALRQMLRHGAEKRLGIANIPNARLAGEIKARELLANRDGLETAIEIRNASRTSGRMGVDPESIYALANETSREAQLHWAGPGADDCFHALFRQPGVAATETAEGPLFPLAKDRLKHWSAYANNPQKGIHVQWLASELREFLLTKLPDYMVPAAYVTLDSLPLTPNGKLDRRALPALDASRPAIRTTYVIPRTQTEQILAEMWSQFLGIERAGSHDNFFELGGHSLLATRVVSRIREVFDVELPLRSFFETPTIGGLAQLLEEARAGGGKDMSREIARVPRDFNIAELPPGGTLVPADPLKEWWRESKAANT
jgi:amino acid adenylation domain-containing protein/non-ribosomal peptide synthase protein (TIGR01720 family)